MEKQSFTKAALALILCAVIAFSAAACSEPAGPGVSESDTAHGGSEPVPAVETEDPAYIADPGLVSLDYTGNTVNIATTNEKMFEFAAEEQTGAAMNDAVFRRNAQVSDDLGVEFAYQEYKQSGGNSSEMKNAVAASIKSGDVTIDFFAAPSYYTTSYITDGYVTDLESIEDSRIDTGKSYWSSLYYNNELLRGRAYFLIGDITPTVIERLEVVFLNDVLAETYLKNTDKSLHDTVLDGEWTFDKLIELTALCGDGSVSGVYGCNLPRNSYSLDGMEAAMKVDLVNITPDGDFEVLVNSQHNIDLVEKLRKYYYENSSVLSENNEAYSAFKTGNSLFAVGLLLESSGFRNAEIDYSIYPLPKWNADQEDYISTSQDNYSIIGIPSNTGDRTGMITAVLEDMCWRSHETVYMAEYEITYSMKYSDSSAEAQMFDFIYRHVDFSFGSIYSYILGEVKNCPRYLLYPTTSTANWNVASPIASSLAGLEKQISMRIKQLNKTLD